MSCRVKSSHVLGNTDATRAMEPSEPHLEDGNNLKEIGVMVWNEVMLGTFLSFRFDGLW